MPPGRVLLPDSGYSVLSSLRRAYHIRARLSTTPRDGRVTQLVPRHLVVMVSSSRTRQSMQLMGSVHEVFIFLRVHANILSRYLVDECRLRLLRSLAPHSWASKGVSISSNALRRSVSGGVYWPSTFAVEISLADDLPRLHTTLNGVSAASCGYCSAPSICS